MKGHDALPALQHCAAILEVWGAVDRAGLVGSQQDQTLSISRPLRGMNVAATGLAGAVGEVPTPMSSEVNFCFVISSCLVH